MNEALDLVIHLAAAGYHEAWIGEGAIRAAAVLPRPARAQVHCVRRGARCRCPPRHRRFVAGLNRRARALINADRMNQAGRPRTRVRGDVRRQAQNSATVGQCVCHGLPPRARRRRASSARCGGAAAARGNPKVPPRPTGSPTRCRAADGELHQADDPDGGGLIARRRQCALAPTTVGTVSAMKSMVATTTTTRWLPTPTTATLTMTAADDGQSRRKNWRITIGSTWLLIAASRPTARGQFGRRAGRRLFSQYRADPHRADHGVTDPLAHLRETRMAVVGTPDDGSRALRRLWAGSGGVRRVACGVDLARHGGELREVRTDGAADDVVPTTSRSMETRSEDYKSAPRRATRWRRPGGDLDRRRRRRGGAPRDRADQRRPRRLARPSPRALRQRWPRREAWHRAAGRAHADRPRAPISSARPHAAVHARARR